MHTVNLSGKSDEEKLIIITKAGRTAKKWEEARKNVRFRKPISEVRKET